MICIYNKDESNFNNNGLAVLEPMECTYKPVINTTWALEMTLPYDNDRKFDYIQNERILKVTGIDCLREFSSTTQFFRIADFKKMDDNIYVLAYPIGLDARFDTFTRNIKMYNKTPSEAISMINALSNKYTVSTSGVEVATKSIEYQNANMIEILNGKDSNIQTSNGSTTYHNFVQTYDAEVCYDNYNIKVNGRLGDSTNPIDVRYGKNVMGLNYGLDASNTISRLYPKAKSGEYLNDIADYKIANNPYVDCEEASDFPIPHIYYCEAPYNLVQLSNDGSMEYTKSIELYTAIRELTSGWLHEALLEDNVVGGLLSEIELGWIINNYDLTMVKDGVEGIVEYLWRNVIYMSRGFNNVHNIVSGSVQSLIYSAMKAGFDNVLKNTESTWYIGTAEKDWLTGSGGPFYSYEWDTAGDFRVKASSGDYVWVYTSSKWRQINDQGYATGATDSAKWKWYKVKGKTYKRYGNKKKSRFLKDDQWWEINNVWYRFTSGGQGIKGSGLTQQFYPFFDIAEIDYGQSSKTLYELLVPVCTDGEADLFELLYMQMTAHCLWLFETEGLAKPTLTLEVNMVDLSKTTEYANYQFLERVHLGDAVKIYHPKLGPEPTTLRIVGLTYDVLKECNTEIQIGVTATSVINLLNSIGSSNNDTKLVFGDSFEVINNKIEVKPPATPYMTDFVVNGRSVVRNHVGYLDLDEMGIDETIDVLYGEEDPDDEDDGEDKDFYLKLGIETANILSLDKFHNENSTEQNPIYITDFTATSRDEYSFVIHGCPDNQGHGEWCYFELDGLVEGNTYELSFKMKFNNGATFPWPYNDYVETCGTAINFARDTNEHEYSCTFTYVAEGTMFFNFPRINDNVNFTATITEMKIVGDFVANQIDEIYNKYEDKWRKYVPAVMQGATSEADGQSGTAPQPLIADKDKFLKGDGSWAHDALSKLADVIITDIEDGDVPKWDATLEKWVNGQGGGTGNVADVYENGVSVLDENHIAQVTSYKEITQSEYDALPDDKLTDDILYCIKDTGIVEGEKFAPIIYSVEEREVGVWVNGKPLYQKTVMLGERITVNSSFTTVVGNMASDNVESIVDALVFDNNGGNDYTLVRLISSDIDLMLDNSKNIIANYEGGYSSKMTGYTIRYTKTTDVAGSGQWASAGVPTVHYDASEQVIGTWFGKPLYQKTIVQNNIDVGYDNVVHSQIAHGVANFKEAHSLTIGCPILGICSGDTLWNANATIIASFRVNSTNIYATGGSNHFGAVSDRYWYFTITYTKTTD